jgi:hypothetical protein
MSPIPGGGEIPGSGTSQAAAHVTGAWALLRQQSTTAPPTGIVDEVLNKLKTTGPLITDPKSNVNTRRIKIDSALGINVPESRWLVTYYNNVNLAEPPASHGDDGTGFIDHNYTNTSPGPGLGTENYSIRWTRTVTFTEGDYRFSVTADDGVRLYIDGVNKIDKWLPQSATTYNINTHLQSGPHEIKLEYYQGAVDAQVRLIWGAFDSGCIQTVAAERWKGEYYNNMNLAGNASLVKDEGSGFLDYNWGADGPSSACNVFTDYFSARWTRMANFAAATYRFTVNNIDDGVRLYVNNNLVINKWVDAAGTNTVEISFTNASSYPVKLEYYEKGGAARANLSWTVISPAAPSNLVASAASPSQINLSWSDNSSNEDGFGIERWNGSAFARINNVGAGVTTFTDSGLAATTTYRYRVNAYTTSGLVSGYSNESSATTSACSYAISPDGAGFPWSGGLGTITVTAAGSCSWSASSDSSWITLFSGSGAGSGSVQYHVDAYPVTDGSRSGRITIAGQSFWIGQEGQPGGCDPHCRNCCLIMPSQGAALDQSATDAEPRGLTARYFDNTTLSGQPSLQRTDAFVNFDWAGARPDAALPADRFSVRWSGQLAAPSSEAYTFHLYSDDGARLWVNNQLVIDRWQPPFEKQIRSAPVELKAGEKAPVRVEYYNAGGEALIQLLWSSASTPLQFIPQQHLYPEAATNKSAPTDTNKQTGMLLPPGSDAGPKATRQQPGEWLAIPLGRAGLATEAPLRMLTAHRSSAGLGMFILKKVVDQYSGNSETPGRKIGERKMASLIFLSGMFLSGMFLIRRFSVWRPRR